MFLTEYVEMKVFRTFAFLWDNPNLHTVYAIISYLPLYYHYGGTILANRDMLIQMYKQCLLCTSFIQHANVKWRKQVDTILRPSVPFKTLTTMYTLSVLIWSSVGVHWQQWWNGPSCTQRKLAAFLSRQCAQPRLSHTLWSNIGY